MQLAGDEKVGSLLTCDSLDRWNGLLLDYYIAPATDRRQFLIGHPCLCLLDSGATRGTVRSGLHTHEVNAAAGVMNLYGPQVDITRSLRSIPDSRRIVGELPGDALHDAQQALGSGNIRQPLLAIGGGHFQLSTKCRQFSPVLLLDALLHLEPVVACIGAVGQHLHHVDD